MPGDLPRNIAEHTLDDSGDGACTPAHAFHAFDALYCALVSNARPIPAEFVDDEYPLFVTWNTCKPGRTPRLRGCLGNFGSQPVRKGIAEYALIAAFRDHRFRRISKSELPTLECGISLLTDFEDIDRWDDWVVGTHGIYITFTPPSSTKSRRSSGRDTLTATYLPQVAEEQGWNQEEALDSAIAKAGYEGPVDEAFRQSVHVQRYQSRKCFVLWDEYVQWRQTHGETVEL